MRHIHALPAAKVPRDSEFAFRERAKSLVDKWHDIISASKTTDTIRKPIANGKHVEDSGAKAQENGEAESPAEAAEKTDAEAMEIDKKDADADAEVDAPAEEDAPADAEVADANMSEGAAA
jgi:hypothetical protein